jgi:small subunit ribosomal protein S20
VANTPQAKKRAKQAEVRRQRNTSHRSSMRTFLKRALKAIVSKDVTLAEQEYRLATAAVDKMVTKGIIHKNKANRHKSRLSAQLKAIAV